MNSISLGCLEIGENSLRSEAFEDDLIMEEDLGADSCIEERVGRAELIFHLALEGSCA